MSAPKAEITVKPRADEGHEPPLAAAGLIVSEVPLRVKGLLAFVAVAVYAVLLTSYTFYKKTELSDEFERLRSFYEVEDQLRQVDAAVLHIVMAVFVNSGTDDQKMGVQRFRENFELLKRKNAELAVRFPFAAVGLAGIERAMAQADARPSEDGLAAMNAELLKVKSEVTRHIDASRQEQKKTAERFHMLWDSAALASLMFGLLGLILLGAIIGLFFTRLTNDLRTLKGRALDIINGVRKGSMPVNRNDEVGELMQAVNHMARALDEREKELVIARQRYFHQEKMAAVGALAAGVAHEIGNPIAAMSGVLQEMAEEQGARAQAAGGVSGKLDMLRAQIRRLSAITREISGYAAPQSAEHQLLDLNGLVRTAAGLMSYDKRMHLVNLRLDLDSQLPAIYGVADQLTQVLMNLLINAADALEPVEDRPREITIRSEVSDGKVRLTVSDNGCGMDTGTLDRAFEAFFTTKSRGTGLGLSICYSFITEHGGTIEIDSAIGRGTRVQVILPLPADDGNNSL
ncbi:MAG: HAMP domain-containing sensor histidine kinase [Gallionella sp.]|nr:MAG: HAMP domain-containing sensor histidine kinase [Gallionella sp.]